MNGTLFSARTSAWMIMIYVISIFFSFYLFIYLFITHLHLKQLYSNEPKFGR